MATAYRRLPQLTDQEIRTFWSQVNTDPGQGPDGECWPWVGPLQRARRSRDGLFYGKTNFGTITFAAHRVAFELANGDIDELKNVLHACDYPPCCNPEHLWQGTTLENNQDKARKHRSILGEFTKKKLPDDEIVQILIALNQGQEGKILAQVFKVSTATISRILNHKAYQKFRDLTGTTERLSR